MSVENGTGCGKVGIVSKNIIGGGGSVGIMNVFIFFDPLLFEPVLLAASNNDCKHI